MRLEPVPGCECALCLHVGKAYARPGQHVWSCWCQKCAPELYVPTVGKHARPDPS